MNPWISILDRKMFRELMRSKAQSFAIAMMVASGIAVFVMSVGVLQFLKSTRDSYYQRYRFADLFVSLVRAPENVALQVRALDGILRVQTRVVADVNLDVPGLSEPAIGRLVSIPDHGPAELNVVHVVRGTLPAPDRFGEVLASEAFIVANRLDVGDSISAVINGHYQELKIVGVGLSPEHVFQMRGGDLLPDDRRFGVFWMRREGLGKAMDMEGAFNDLSIQLQRQASPEEVVAAVDQLLAPHGTLGAITRSEQVSAKFLDDEIKQLRATGLVAPAIFMGVGAFLLNVILSRRVHADRESIATLRAFGYRGWEIASHYLRTALLITIAGALIGSVAGHWMGIGLARVYQDFYRFPEFVYRVDWRVFFPALGIAFGAALLGTFHAVMDVIAMRPADAMRPPAPPRYRPAWIERMGLGFLFPLSLRMILRQLERRGISAFFSVLGIAAAVAVMLLSGFAPDALDYLLHFQFNLAQRQDIQVTLKEVHSPRALHDLQKLPGVQQLEPFRAVPVRFRYAHRHYRTALLGLGDERSLFRLLNARERPIRLPPSGVILSEQLAEILGVDAGGTVEIDVLEGEKNHLRVEVAGIVSELAGANAYMRLDPLHRLLREGNTISGAFLAVDPRFEEPLYRQLKATPAVAAVTVKHLAVEQFREIVARNTLLMQSFTAFFATVLAVGVIYNTARISLDERRREFATLRVIGFTRWEVAMILLGELGLMTLLAIPLGWGIGVGFCWAVVVGFESDNFRIPLVIERQTMLRAALVALVATVVSGLLVRRRLEQIDLVEVLKSR